MKFYVKLKYLLCFINAYTAFLLCMSVYCCLWFSDGMHLLNAANANMKPTIKQSVLVKVFK